MTKKVLNLYAGIGGNRKLWEDVEVTAVELNPEIAAIYHDFFPDDRVIVADAHQYLLEHYDDGWDFIWSSPPCQTHSRTNYFLKGKGIIRYPDMSLYEEVIFLHTYSSSPFCIENVIPYYEPQFGPQIIGRHCLWANFSIHPIRQKKDEIGKMCGRNQKAHRKSLEERNAVNPKLGKHIFDCAFKLKQEKLF